MGDRKGNFTPEESVLDRSDGFRIAGGTCWNKPVQYRLAMRWEYEAGGYPPEEQWFTLPQDLSLQMAEMLESSPVDGIQTDELQDALEKLRGQMNRKAG